MNFPSDSAVSYLDRMGIRSVAVMWLGVVVVGAAACSRAPASAEVTAPAPAPEPECTLQTPLKPGIPGSPGNLIPSSINPNGVSELAALMRQMLEDMRTAREALQKGEQPPLLGARHSKLRCSWPTDAHMRDAEFDTRAQAYLAAERALDARQPDARTAYAATVESCVACHSVSCEGPVPLIESLRLP